MADHAAHCALVLYAGMKTIKPVECDCDVDEPKGEPSDADWAAAEAKARAERDRPAQLTIVGPALDAYLAFRAAQSRLRILEDEVKAALMKLTEELAK